MTQPSHVRSCAARSRSSLRRSNAVRYRSYESRNWRSTRDEKMSSPRGFDEGGIGDRGTTEELRFESRPSRDGERRLVLPPSVGVGVGLVGVGAGVGVGDVRPKSIENGLKGSLDRSGGWRTFRYILKFLSARFAWGTYLQEK